MRNAHTSILPLPDAALSADSGLAQRQDDEARKNIERTHTLFMHVHRAFVCLLLRTILFDMTINHQPEI